MIYLFLLIILILLDQSTKVIFGNVKNYGAAFGLLQGQLLLFIIISFMVIALCIYYYRIKKLRLPLILILAGTIGNLIDRLFLGYVRDFIDLKIWPVFNLADSLYVIGVALLIYILWKKKITP